MSTPGRAYPARRPQITVLIHDAERRLFLRHVQSDLLDDGHSPPLWPLGARIRNPYHGLWRVSPGITLCITYVLSASCGLVSAARPACALDFPHDRRGAAGSASCAPMPPSRSRLATLAGDGPMVNAGVRCALQFPEPQSRQGAVQRRNLSEARRMTGLCKGKRMRYPFWFVQLIIS